ILCRDAFAFISVIDANTKQPMGGVKVLPTDRAVIQRRQKQRFEIHVEEPLCDGNTETRSAFGSTNSLCSRTYYVIRVIWAEELLRHRLKRAEEAGQHNWTIDGYSFTKFEFLNERMAKITAACNGPYSVTDKDTFECRLRVLCICVSFREPIYWYRLKYISKRKFFCLVAKDYARVFNLLVLL
uniref:Uncharacterized protein n=1 Tax=Parascaris univalens TaxID=6257 RepID=A0A914ZVW8_PARUN